MPTNDRIAFRQSLIRSAQDHEAGPAYLVLQIDAIRQVISVVFPQEEKEFRVRKLFLDCQDRVNREGSSATINLQGVHDKARSFSIANLAIPVGAPPERFGGLS